MAGIEGQVTRTTTRGPAPPPLSRCRLWPLVIVTHPLLIVTTPCHTTRSRSTGHLTPWTMTPLHISPSPPPQGPLHSSLPLTPCLSPRLPTCRLHRHLRRRARRLTAATSVSGRNNTGVTPTATPGPTTPQLRRRRLRVVHGVAAHAPPLPSPPGRSGGIGRPGLPHPRDGRVHDGLRPPPPATRRRRPTLAAPRWRPSLAAPRLRPPLPTSRGRHPLAAPWNGAVLHAI